MPPVKDLTGQRFERLLVLHRVPGPRRGSYWRCLCDCGTTTDLYRGVLTSGNTKSCGCLKAEQKIHELGWDHPDVANPRRRELYAQKRAMGYTRVRNDAYYERKRARHQERRDEDPEALRELWNKNSKTYRKTHPEKVVADNLKFRTENPEYGRAWYEMNKEARAIYNALYYKKHPEIQLENTRRRRVAKLQAPCNDFTPAQWKEMQEAYDHRCVYCGKRAKGRLTQDHLTPLSKGGSHTASNVVPACKSCNSKKHTGPVLKPVQPMLLLLSEAKDYKPK